MSHSTAAHLCAGLIGVLQQVGASGGGVANAAHRPEAPVLHAEHLRAHGARKLTKHEP